MKAKILTFIVIPCIVFLLLLTAKFINSADWTSQLNKIAGEKVTKVQQQSKIGTIVFSSQPPVNNVITSRKDTFTAGENIYALIQLKDTLSNILIPFHRNTGFPTIDFKIVSLDDKRNASSLNLDQSFAMPRNNPKIMNAKVIPLDIMPESNKVIWKQWDDHEVESQLQQLTKVIAQKLSSLSPGKHVVYLQIMAESAEDKHGYNFMWQPIAEGSFTFIVDEKSATKLKRIAEKEKWIDKMPKAALKDPGLEKQMVQAIKDRGETRQILRIVITERGWTIVRNSITGIIMYRAISASVALKDIDGICKVYHWGFTQPYVGGKFGAIEAQNPDQIGPNAIKYIECSDILK